MCYPVCCQVCIIQEGRCVLLSRGVPAGAGMHHFDAGELSGLEMVRTGPFDAFSDEYDAWFDRHKGIYELEVEAVKALFRPEGRGVEIGVGSGRFAAALGVELGLEPSRRMADKAKARGIEVVEGTAEHVPFRDFAFDFVLMVTTICFLDDVERAFEETHRVLKAGAPFIVAFIDRKSELGREYLSGKSSSKFYRLAHFFSAEEVLGSMTEAGFAAFAINQTLFPGDGVQSIEEGFGKGAFVTIRGERAR